MDRHFFTRTLRNILVVITSAVLLVGPLADVVNAQPRNAPGAGGGGGIPVAVLADAPALAQGTYDNILTEITRAGVVAFFNALQVFFGQIAYDAASYIASGGKGQEAMYYKKGFGQYLQDVASDSAGEFIGSLSQDGDFFKKIGYDLCRPTDPRKLLRIQVGLGQFFPGLQGKFTRPRPKCNFQQVVENYNTLYQTMSNSEVLSNIELSLNQSSNDLGVSATIFGRSAASVRLKTDQAALARGEGQGFKAVTDIVSGNVKTPGQVVAEATKEEVIRRPGQNQIAATGAILNNAFRQGPIQLATYTASVFVNTLASKMLKRIFEKGLGAFDFSDLATKPDVTSPDSIVTGGKTDARNANIDLRTPNLQKVTQFEVMSEFVACPPTKRGPWNCTVDQALAQAIQTRSDQGGFTVKEALTRNLLHADWRLIPATQNRENQDPLCYTYGYCVGNLEKLRLMRILSVGFEFAANATENISRCTSASGCITLGEVVQNFANCNTAGTRDSSHPWCHLIDPNWVITSMPQQCVLSGYDDTLLSGSLARRTEQCQDVQTCLKRNDNGDCVGGYGYCMAEKTVYRFDADECPARAASCRNYTSRAGQQVALLRNTLDYAQCSTDNAGCLWYATQRDPSGDRVDNWIGTTTTGPRVYFDKTLEVCAASDEGCTQLRQVSLGVSALNLLINPSFERLSTAAGASSLDAWRSSTPFVPPTSPTGTVAMFGGSSVAVAAGFETFSQPVVIAPQRMYTMSFYGRTKDPAGAPPLTTIVLNEYQDEALTRTIPSAERTRADGSLLLYHSAGCVTTIDPMIKQRSLTDNWQRFECSFLTASSTRYGLFTLNVSNALVDGVQLEEGEFATPFVDGLNESLASVNLKVAPDEFACSGSASDHPGCEKFAKVCRQAEAGCQGYTDNVASGPEIPAIVTTNDLCPQSCIGYAEYRKTPSAFDLVHDVDARFDDPADATSSYFIPSTAQSCKQAEVGCEEFTNVEAAAAGGESVAFFSYIRSCERPGANSQTYFTWEGSDTAGYQLRTWSLISETPDGSVPPRTGPKIQVKRGPDQFVKEPDTCNEAAWRSGVDADCRQIYDAAGNIFYRYFSQTVLSTPQCASYRLNRTNQDDCRKTFGTYDVRTGACVYQMYVPENRTCSANAASCRAFAGATAGSSETALNQSFRTDTGSFTNGVRSNESVLVGDSSLRIDNAADARQSVRTTVDIPTEPGALYRISFWAKTTVPTAQLFVSGARSVLDVANARVAGVVNVNPDWQRYSVGPFDAAPGTVTTTLVWTVPAGASSFVLFLDEVNVTRLQDMAYVRANSWNTPAECDRSTAGSPEPQAMLNCRAYHDRRQLTVNVRQFTRLCRETAIGCGAFVDTRNSASVAAESFVQADVPPIAGYGAATTTRLADRYVYVIDEPSKRCADTSVSCRAFGKPIQSPDRSTVPSMQTVYYKDDITKYGEALCKPSELYCDEFSGTRGKEYFRDPQNHVCEYRENVQVPRASDPTQFDAYNGWFQKDSTTPCYPSSLESGRTYNILRRGDVSYADWGGLCDPQAGECTEFRDTNDTSDPLYPTGKPYNFIRNDRLDTSSCNNSVDVGNGCILLRDMSDTRLTSNVAASYAKYQSANYVPTTPVDCTASPRDATCGSTAANDANLIVKVNVDRDCSQWLGCSSSESVFDPSTGRYKDLCTNLSLCDRASDRPGDIFCANYVDRSSTSTERMLSRGVYFDINQYESRKIGLGERDYSGYSIPDNFLVPDTASVRVAVDGMKKDTTVGYRYALDYRLAATVNMPPVRTKTPAGEITLLREPNRNEAKILDVRTELGRRYPDLRLCQHVGSGRIGYYLENDAQPNTGRPVTCYLPVSPVSDAYDFPTLSQKFALLNPNADPVLNRAFPEPECRAFPETDSPYPASFVTRWDTTKNPPEAADKIAGFASANTCEFGEECSCSYKRADYSDAAVSKFYNVFSQNIPPGICQGGPRDGQSCLPDTVYKAPTMTGLNTADGRATAQAIVSANSEQNCGPVEGGGRCVAFSKVSIVRGAFGQCLQRDITRNIGNDLNQHPCLTWNPTPILFGEKDTYHYAPNSGYLPPENSGQYYCTSYARAPRETKLNGSFFAVRPYAGGIEKLEYDDYFVSLSRLDFIGESSRLSIGTGFSDSVGNRVPGLSNVAGDQPYLLQSVANFPGGSIDALRPEGTRTAQLCTEAIGFQSNGGLEYKDAYGLRLIGTGRFPNQSYAETFFAANSEGFAHWLFNLPTSTGSSPAQARAALEEKNFSFFTIKPIVNPNGFGRLACGYQEQWVDDMDTVKYNDAQSLKTADKEWQRKFNENYNPNLTRSTEKFFARSETGVGYKVPCIRVNPKDTTMGDQCYLKTWELGYRAENQTNDTNFIGLYPQNDQGIVDPAADDARLRSLEDMRHTPTYKTCDSDKPYFMIRAVFQTSASSTLQSACGSDGTRCTESQVQGPWRFVGFWTVTCGGRLSNDSRYIYMEVTAHSADICRDLAEVRSVNSHQDAAFTDRVWKESGYVVPGIGTQYSSRFSPFSSALNTKPAGKEPLFQTGTDRVGFSRLNPPNFLGAGIETYFRDAPYPRDKWAYLSNIFARIYRIYTYYEQPVSRQDNACLSGPFIGQRCTVPAVGGHDSCSINGLCDPNAILPGEGDNVKFCNAFSGINAGLRCEARNADDDPCHSGPIVRDQQSGDAKVLLSGCVMNPELITKQVLQKRYRCGDGGGPGSAPDAGGRWTNPSGDIYNGPCTAATGESDPDAGLNVEQSAARGAFVCDSNSVNPGQFCSSPASQSKDCALRIEARCSPQGGVKRCQFDATTTPTLAVARTKGFQLDTNGFVNDDYPVCKENTDCRFDSWSFWSPGPIPYGYRTNFEDASGTLIARSHNDATNTDAPEVAQVGQTKYSYLQRKPVTTGWLWGPIYSMRSTINYHEGLGQIDSLGFCFNMNKESSVIAALGGASYGGDRLCIGVTTINAQGVTGGANPTMTYASYFSRPALGPYFTCSGCLAEGRLYNNSGWSMDATRPGLWNNKANGNDWNVPAVRHNTELLRDPGVGEAVTPGYRDHGVGTGNDYYFNLAACESTERLSASLNGATFDGAREAAQAARGRYGRCVGGIYEGRICRISASGLTVASQYRCDAPGIPDYGKCGAVATSLGGGNYRASSGSLVTPAGSVSYDCRKGGGTGPGAAPDAQTNPDLDNNICTHNIGYYPRVNLCPNPDNEYCGLISYDIAQTASRTGGSLDPRTPYPLPTDVTLGHYAPGYFGFDGGTDIPQSVFNYVGYYTPKPPRVAAPDIRNCATPGSCTIQRLDQISFNGQSEGIIGVAGGQHKSTLRFYAWAAHEQMPLRQVLVDWGDGTKVELNDAKIRNHKPFCGVQKECWSGSTGHTGLTCNTDSDCPAGVGTCLPIGNCTKRTNIVCSRDSECATVVNGKTIPDSCNVRTFFGNSPEACETNYFNFEHEYSCNANASSSLPPCAQVPGAAAGSDVAANQCFFGANDQYVLNDGFRGTRPQCSVDANCVTAYESHYGAGTAPTTGIHCGPTGAGAATEGRCSRDPARSCANSTQCAVGDTCIPNGLAPPGLPGGCWDQAALSCRYTPRVLIQDNWGWCTGECRNTITGGSLTDSDNSKVIHQYGGCYAGRPLGTEQDDSSSVKLNNGRGVHGLDECDGARLPGDVVRSAADPSSTSRPWIVYPGSLQLRRR